MDRITDAKYGEVSSGGASSANMLQTSAGFLLAQISAKLDKTNELLELILTALDEKKGSATSLPQLQKKFANVQQVILDDMKQHGGGTVVEIASRMNMPENSIGPGLCRLWHKGLVSIERVPGSNGPVSHYKIK